MLHGFHIPTVFLMIIIVCLLLALCFGWVNWREDRDGLRTWALALCVHAGGYVLLALRGSIWDVVSIVLANTCIAFSYSLQLKAVLKFLDRSISPVVMWLPTMLTAIAFGALMHSAQYRIAVGNSITLAQCLLICRVLVGARLGFQSQGRHLAVAGLCLAMALIVWRVSVVLLRPQEVAALFQASTVQVVSYMTVFVAMVMLSNGFYMMAKERSDMTLRAVAMRDALTGCWNRLYIEEAARQELARLRRYGTASTLLMIDLDHFKAINDQFGHNVGDVVLRQFCDIVRQRIRATDLLGRWGGEEFVVILPSTSFEDALPLAERIRGGLEAEVFPEGFRVTASLGLSCCRATDSWANWLGRADEALYRAKHAGRNQTVAEVVDLRENVLECSAAQAM